MLQLEMRRFQQLTHGPNGKSEPGIAIILDVLQFLAQPRGQLKQSRALCSLRLLA
jgi:hypothetical protein